MILEKIERFINKNLTVYLVENQYLLFTELVLSIQKYSYLETSANDIPGFSSFPFTYLHKKN